MHAMLKLEKLDNADLKRAVKEVHRMLPVSCFFKTLPLGNL